MSVLIVTSLGEIVVDLQADKCPWTCKNFLKLCKTKYYNGCLFHAVQKDFTAQTVIQLEQEMLMDNALIDDRRIHVDFSQSVSKLWSQYRRKDHMGRDSFKCGATDHIAKDCTGNPSLGQQTKYTLKEENAQHGEGNGRYQMVLDGNNPGNPRLERKHEGDYQSKDVDKHSPRQSSKDNGDRKPRYQEKEDLDDRHGHGFRSRCYGDDNSKDRRYERSTRYHDYVERKERGDEENATLSRWTCKMGERSDCGDAGPERSDLGDYRNKHSHEERKYYDRGHRNENGEKRRKRSVDDHRKRNNDWDYKKKHEKIDRRDMRTERSHRKSNADDDGRERRQERKPDHSRRDSEHDRRHRLDR